MPLSGWFVPRDSEADEWDYYVKYGQIPDDEADYALEAREFADRDLDKAPVLEVPW